MRPGLQAKVSERAVRLGLFSRGKGSSARRLHLIITFGYSLLSFKCALFAILASFAENEAGGAKIYPSAQVSDRPAPGILLFWLVLSLSFFLSSPLLSSSLLIWSDLIWSHLISSHLISSHLCTSSLLFPICISPPFYFLFLCTSIYFPHLMSIHYLLLSIFFVSLIPHEDSKTDIYIEAHFQLWFLNRCRWVVAIWRNNCHHFFYGREVSELEYSSSALIGSAAYYEHISSHSVCIAKKQQCI